MWQLVYNYFKTKCVRIKIVSEIKSVGQGQLFELTQNYFLCLE